MRWLGGNPTCFYGDVFLNEFQMAVVNVETSFSQQGKMEARKEYLCVLEVRYTQLSAEDAAHLFPVEKDVVLP